MKKENKRFQLAVDYLSNNPKLKISYKPYSKAVKDVLVQKFIESTKYPNGYKSQCPIDVPRGVYILEEMFPSDDCGINLGETSSQMRPEDIVETYTLVPLNEAKSLQGEKIKYKKYDNPTVEESIEQLKALTKLLNFGEKHVSKIEEYLKECETTLKINTQNDYDSKYQNKEVELNCKIDLYGDIAGDIEKLQQIKQNAENYFNNEKLKKEKINLQFKK